MRFQKLMMKNRETFLLHGGKLYDTRKQASDAAKRYERRTGAVPVDTIDTHDPAPTSGDAREWDAWRLRGGIAG
jgi:hypothetical protein